MENNLKFGDRVKHSEYGNGFVKSICEEDDNMIDVIFENEVMEFQDRLVQVPCWSLEKI